MNSFSKGVTYLAAAILRRSPHRKLAWRRACRSGGEVAFRRNGFIWIGSTHCNVTRRIFFRDRYQDGQLGELIRCLQVHSDFSRPVVVNVGANIGDVALPLGRLGKRVIAIEPHPETFQRLDRNVKQNGLAPRITCCELAISDKAGEAELALAAHPGNSELRGPEGKVAFQDGDRVCGSARVSTARIDGLLNSLAVAAEEVALVWSDTQGHESQVIESGPALWEKGTPLWVEVWPKGLACHGGVERFLRACEQNFTHLIRTERLGCPPEPISHLAQVIGSLKPADFTDALLLRC